MVGAAPPPRTGHSAVLLPDGYTIMIHGGWDPEDEGGAAPGPCNVQLLEKKKERSHNDAFFAFAGTGDGC